MIVLRMIAVCGITVRGSHVSSPSLDCLKADYTPEMRSDSERETISTSPRLRGRDRSQPSPSVPNILFSPCPSKAQAYNLRSTQNEVLCAYSFFCLHSCLLGITLALPRLIPAAKPAPGFSIDNIDKTLDPCVDFYQYACGNWLKTTEIPADQSSWVSFIELDERNLMTLREILEKASANNPNRSADRSENRRLLRLLHGRKGSGRKRPRFARSRNWTASPP